MPLKCRDSYHSIVLDRGSPVRALQAFLWISLFILRGGGGGGELLFL